MIYVKYAGAKIYEYYVCSMQHVLGTFGPWGGCGVVTAGVPSRLLDWTLRSFQHRTSTPPTTHFAKLITLDGLSIGIAPWKTRQVLHMSCVICPILIALGCVDCIVQHITLSINICIYIMQFQIYQKLCKWI